MKQPNTQVSFHGTVDKDGITVSWSNDQKAGGTSYFKGEGAAEAAAMLEASPHMATLLKLISETDVEAGKEADQLAAIRQAAEELMSNVRARCQAASIRQTKERASSCPEHADDSKDQLRFNALLNLSTNNGQMLH